MSEENTNVEVDTNTSNTDENGSNSAESKPVENMSTVEDLKAQIQNLTLTNAKLKRANDKLASENGDLNKKYREKLSDDEKRSLEMAEAEAKRQEEYESMAEQIKTLQREKNITELTNSYLSMGWSGDEASRMAVADADNDIEKRMQIMTEVMARQKKEFDVEVLKNRKPVNVSSGASVDITKEQFDKMGYSEMLAFKQSNPELFEQFSR